MITDPARISSNLSGHYTCQSVVHGSGLVADADWDMYTQYEYCSWCVIGCRCESESPLTFLILVVHLGLAVRGEFVPLAR